MEKKPPRVFVSYSRKDYDIVKRLIADLHSNNIDVYIDKVGLKPGTPDWEQALRDAINAAQALLLIASTSSRQSPYVRDEIAIARAKHKAIYPVWVAGDEWIDSIPMGLGHTQFVDIRGESYSTGLPQLVNALHGKSNTLTDITQATASIKPPPHTPDTPPRNPYKGLHAFRAEDRHDFFGRSVLVAELTDAFRRKNGDPRFLAVIGPSGSGKSSVVMAGLLPALQDGAMNGSSTWIYLDPVLPGAHPLENLAIHLARKLPQRAQHAILEDLNDPTTRGLHRLGSEIVTQPGGQLVLYVDQFEELFTLTQNEDERQQFVDLLTTAACEPHGSVLVILSIRADFYDRPMQKYAELGALMETHSKAVLPMMLADLYEVVQEPANLPGVCLQFDEGLVTELVFAVREEVGGLPLLQFTLDQLFQRRTDRCLTREAYAAIGGVHGALAQHAEATYLALPGDHHRQMARALFLRLIDPGVTEQDTTRRRALLTELDLPDAEKMRLMHDAAEAFTQARLLVTAKNGDETTIEVAHEALIREWTRLGGWLHDSRADIYLQQALSADVSDWVRRGKRADDDLLYRGTVLEDARNWARRNPASLEELAFINASSQAEAEFQAEQARIAGRVQNFRRATIVFGIVFLLALIAVVFAGIQTQNARQEQTHAEDLMDEAQAKADYLSAVQDRAATLGAGGIIIPDTTRTQSPTEFYASMTEVAEWNKWIPATEVMTLDNASNNPNATDANQQLDAEMVYVPAGCFWMGSVLTADEQPIHEVCFTQGFWIDQFEVTNADYAACVASGRCDWSGEMLGSERDNYPVADVNWEQARVFCTWRDARLPTESEWEYAARGPDSQAYPWGNQFENGESVGNSKVSYAYGMDYESEEVGFDQRTGGISWVGAYDMSGNIAEWVDACYTADYPAGQQIDPTPPQDECTWGILRGGSLNSNQVSLRSAYRSLLMKELSTSDSGFRCARSESSENK